MKNTNLIIGKKGIGKTSMMFDEVKNIINNNESFVVVDNKDEYYKNFMEELNSKGYTSYIINLSNPKKSNGFNILTYPYELYKNGNKDLAVKLIKSISHELIKSDTAMDPFWDNSASSYLTGLILILFREAKEEEYINLGSVLAMVSQINENETTSKDFANYVKLFNVLSPEYISLSGTVFAPVDTRGGIISVLKGALNKYVMDDSLLNMLYFNEISINDIKDKTAIFIINNNEYNKLTNVILTELMSKTISDNIKFNYILDNSDSMTKLNGLVDILDCSSVNNQKVYLISRNIDEVKIKYGNFIDDKFDEVINVTEEKKYNEIGNYNIYPNIKNVKKNFIYIKNIIAIRM